MTNEEAIGEGRRCNFHEIEYLRSVLIAEKERVNAGRCQDCEAPNSAYGICHGCYVKEKHRGDMWQARSEAAESQVASLTHKLKAAEKVIEAARFIGTEHSALCSIVACNCVGHATRRADLAAALSELTGE